MLRIEACKPSAHVSNGNEPVHQQMHTVAGVGVVDVLPEIVYPLPMAGTVVREEGAGWGGVVTPEP